MGVEDLHWESRTLCETLIRSLLLGAMHCTRTSSLTITRTSTVLTRLAQ